MAKFKVGDRVKRRVTGGPGRPDLRADIPAGAVGTVTGLDLEGDCYVRFDNDQGSKICFAWTLEPLTPPADEQWAADKVKQVTKPQHMEPAVSRDGVVIFP